MQYPLLRQMGHVLAIGMHSLKLNSHLGLAFKPPLHTKKRFFNIKQTDGLVSDVYFWLWSDVVRVKVRGCRPEVK